MATDGTPPGSAPNQAPSEPPVDPQHTEATSVSSPCSSAPPPAVSVTKPKYTSSSPAALPNAHPLQVHVPPYASGYHRAMPGGLLQPMAAHQLPSAQAGLIPFPYGQPQYLAAAMPRAALPNQAASLAALQAHQPMLVSGGGIMRPQRRTLQPMVHPYQRISPHQAAAAQVPSAAAQPMQLLTAARAAAVQQLPPSMASPYGQMFIPVSSAGLQYRLPVMQPQPMGNMALDPATAALHSQYAQYAPYLQQMQHTAAASAAAAPSVSAYGQQYFDPQKLLANAHYTQMLMPDQNSSPPSATAINGTASATVVDGQDQS